MSLRTQKLKMWQSNPYCHWCGCLTILTNDPFIKGNENPRMATVDHLYSKYNPMRFVRPLPGERRRVLSCCECNAKRQADETKALTLEELRRRGAGYCLNPKGKRLHNDNDSLTDVLDKLKEFDIIQTNEMSNLQRNEDTNGLCDGVGETLNQLRDGLCTV